MRLAKTAVFCGHKLKVELLSWNFMGFDLINVYGSPHIYNKILTKQAAMIDEIIS